MNNSSPFFGFSCLSVSPMSNKESSGWLKAGSICTLFAFVSSGLYHYAKGRHEDFVSAQKVEELKDLRQVPSGTRVVLTAKAVAVG